MTILYSLLEAVTGFFVILCLWVYILGVVRRHSGCKNPDKDILDFLLNGCSGSTCTGKGLCHPDLKRETR